jgi:uncharacterized Zn finger protein
MEHRRYEIKTYYSVPICDNCGNDLDDTYSSEILTSYPPQKKFKCNTCGIIYTLAENDWPKISYEWVRREI